MAAVVLGSCQQDTISPPDYEFIELEQVENHFGKGNIGIRVHVDLDYPTSTEFYYNGTRAYIFKGVCKNRYVASSSYKPGDIIHITVDSTWTEYLQLK